jgi:hypothetical protein
MLNRGGLNLDYSKGFQIEGNKFIEYKHIILKLLTAEDIELTSRSVLDTRCGIDAIATINKQQYFIGLRFRKTNKDYNTITFSRHYTDVASELKKFLNNRVKPDFFISISEVNNKLRIVEVNIDSFVMYIKTLLINNQLDNFYNERLMAYEFDLNNFQQLEHGIRNYLIDKVYR